MSGKRAPPPTFRGVIAELPDGVRLRLERCDSLNRVPPRTGVPYRWFPCRRLGWCPACTERARGESAIAYTKLLRQVGIDLTTTRVAQIAFTLPTVPFKEFRRQPNLVVSASFDSAWHAIAKVLVGSGSSGISVSEAASGIYGAILRFNPTGRARPEFPRWAPTVEALVPVMATRSSKMQIKPAKLNPDRLRTFFASRFKEILLKKTELNPASITASSAAVSIDGGGRSRPLVWNHELMSQHARHWFGASILDAETALTRSSQEAERTAATIKTIVDIDECLRSVRTVGYRGILHSRSKGRQANPSKVPSPRPLRPSD